MDIEGYECESFDSFDSLLAAFDEGEVPISQSLIEIHLDPGRRTVNDFLAWWKNLEAVGYRAAWTEPNVLTVSLPLADGMPRHPKVSRVLQLCWNTADPDLDTVLWVDLETGLPSEARRKILPPRAKPWWGRLDLNQSQVGYTMVTNHRKPVLCHMITSIVQTM